MPLRFPTPWHVLLQVMLGLATAASEPDWYKEHVNDLPTVLAFNNFVQEKEETKEKVAQAASANDTVAQPAALTFTPTYGYQHMLLGLANYDYRSNSYVAGTRSGKNLYLCTVSDESSGQKRFNGIAYYQDGVNTPWPSRCLGVWRSEGGANSVLKYDQLGIGMGQSIVILPYAGARDIFKWRNSLTSLKGCDQGGAPFLRTCNLFNGQYPENYATQGRDGAIRRFCRTKLPSGRWAYGWTDAIWDKTTNQIKYKTCYAVKNPLANEADLYKSSNIVAGWNRTQMLGFSDSYITMASRIGPAEGCTTYLAKPNYPNNYWPGMAGNDMSEGAFTIAANIASCAYWCTQVEGCKGYSYTAAYGWCWMKPNANFGNQNINNQPAGSVTLPVSTSGNAADCPASPTRLDYGYSAILPDSMTKPLSSGSCATSTLVGRANWAECGYVFVSYAETIEECCNLVKWYNQQQGRTASDNFTFMRIYNQCFLRAPGCNQRVYVFGEAVSGVVRL